MSFTLLSQKWATYLDDSLQNARETDRISSTVPDLNLTQAYLIQEEGIRLRLGRGQKIIGMKMGLTSKAKREQMGLHLPIYGVLTDQMQILDGTFSLKAKRSIHPKVEPEIAFRTSVDLRGPVSRDQALESISEVMGALEILDSRYVGFKYFSLPDVVADNSSSAFFVLGDSLKINLKSHLSQLKLEMWINGRLSQSALASEISGDPVQSLVQLCDLLQGENKFLPKGSIVLAGAATTAVQLELGMDVVLKVDDSVNAQFKVS